MTVTAAGMVLWLVVLWPLLLSIPALHRRLPWPRQLALLPVLVLFLLPTTTALKLPWLLFGSGLALSADLRWLLAMFIVVWWIAAAQFKIFAQGANSSRATTFFLLTLAGNLGTLLAADLVGFFVFATLMGYSFYGLMLAKDEAAAKNTARCYVVALIVGDLALFEALLLAAGASNNLQYAAVQQAMADSSTLPLYLAMVLAGFIVKAGLWPAHIWLTAALRTVSPLPRILLAAVPVAMAMLGTVRWLPVEMVTAATAGYVLQVLGALMLVSASVKWLRARVGAAGWGMLCLIGLFFFLFGHTLIQPSAWRSYAPFVSPYLAIMGIASCLLLLPSLRRNRAQAGDTLSAQTGHCLPERLLAWLSVLRRATVWSKLTVGTQANVTMLKNLGRALTASGGHKPVIPGGVWAFAVTVFVLLILLFAALAG
ncbi:MAG: proton-conducting transporter membrane subunit [Gammaproteobacteria bacterium]